MKNQVKSEPNCKSSEQQKDYGSLVRNNLMTRQHYSPYCGNQNCQIMPRTVFTEDQFKCSVCGWTSKFDKEFITEYKKKWGGLLCLNYQLMKK